MDGRYSLVTVNNRRYSLYTDTIQYMVNIVNHVYDTLRKEAIISVFLALRAILLSRACGLAVAHQQVGSG